MELEKEIYIVIDEDFLENYTEAICAFNSFADAEKYVHRLFTESWDEVTLKEEEKIVANKEKNFYYKLGDKSSLDYTGIIKIQAIPLFSEKN